MFDRAIRCCVVLFVLSVFVLSFVSGQEGKSDTEKVGVGEKTICCEKTRSGLYCQDVPEKDCAPNSRKIPTSCESTSFCKGGFCFDSVEGTCLDNTPQMVCNAEKGTWAAEQPPQCNLGCCILGDQASFVTLTSCKRWSGFLGLETNYDSSISDVDTCLLTARAEEKGACVYYQDFEKTCKFTKRSECTLEAIQGKSSDKAEDSGSGGQSRTRLAGERGTLSGAEGLTPAPREAQGTQGATEEQQATNGAVSESVTGRAVGVVNTSAPSNVEFFEGKLCSAEELGTNCGITKQTICVPGREEVYFADTCGNPANVYDASKVNDKAYWANVKDVKESCNPTSANSNSQTCGNCNYLLGSYCREASSDGAQPTYGTNICADLNCVDFDGKKRLHGESWCMFDRTGGLSSLLGGTDPVGSKFYRHICNNGEIVVEPCADFRQEECLEDSIDTGQVKFSQAACLVNRWQDCTAQKDQRSCTNKDRRDCRWLEGIEYILMGAVLNGSTIDGNSLGGLQERAKQAVREAGGIENIPKGACVPKNPPGLRFWEGNEATGICAQANAVCPVTYEKGLVGGGWKCVKNCFCLEPDTEAKRAQLCMAIGDCGPNVNFLGQAGSGLGYKITKQKIGGKKDK